eukprot:1733135-Rhodomonas_salina.2
MHASASTSAKPEAPANRMRRRAEGDDNAMIGSSAGLPFDSSPRRLFSSIRRIIRIELRSRRIISIEGYKKSIVVYTNIFIS